MLQLSVPCFYKNGEIYDRCDIIKPKTGVIAEAYEIMEEAGEYPAILEFISGGIKNFYSIDEKIIEDKSLIKAICRRMPYITSEVVALKIMSLVNPDDWIEGVYPCPRCGKQIITGVNNENDNRDRIDDLEIVNMGEDSKGEIDFNEYDNNIHIDCTEPIRILHAKTEDVLHEITSIDLRFPTINDCIIGMQKYPASKDAKRQFAIYANSLTRINGEEIDIKWKKTWGEFIFNNMDSDDLTIIGDQMEKYGMKKTIERTCRKCGKVWKAPVNTSNFFVSGLQSV